MKLIYDRLSVPFLVLSLVFCGTIGGFAVRYMHRERGYNRFFVLYSVFVLGMVLTAVAGTIETLFTGWELVGLSSALPVAFFQERPAPSRNGLRVWVAELFASGSFATALMFATPLTGVYLAVRLVLPVCPDWLPQSIGVASLLTAVYAAGLAVVQTEARRFFACVFLSHASVVLAGLELGTAVSLTGSLFLGPAVALSLAGLGLTLRAVEARFGRVGMGEFRGLYDHSPALAVCFLLTGLCSVGYVAAEMLIDGAVGGPLPGWANAATAVAVAVAAALNGIAVVRAYFLIFTGGRHVPAVSLGITRRERFAVLTLAALILGGGLFPQPGVESRFRAAEERQKQD